MPRDNIRSHVAAQRRHADAEDAIRAPGAAALPGLLEGLLPRW